VTGREVSVDEKEEQKYRVNMANKMIRSSAVDIFKI